jgi:hypothetical protein
MRGASFARLRRLEADDMRRSIKTSLALVASGAALLFVDGRARSGSRRMLAGARRLVVRRPVVDAVVTKEVRAKLDDVTDHAKSIRTEVDHGCVVLSGDVLTNERGRLVREISNVPSVDSVVDLMKEHEDPDELPSSVHGAMHIESERPRSRATRMRGFVRDLSLPARVVAGGAGLGLSLVGMRLRGFIGIPLGVIGVILFARAIAFRARRSEGSRTRREVAASSYGDETAPITVRDPLCAPQPLEAH